MSSSPKPLNIYLAGKIAKRGWREEILGRHLGAFDDQPEVPPEFVSGWPVLKRAIFDAHHYVGPYFIADDHGCAHGPNLHGAAAGGTRNGCIQGAPTRRQVAFRCLEAVLSADLVFVYLDGPDAHGTLVEIGYALGHEIDVAIGWSPRLSTSDLWFPLELACHVVGPCWPNAGLRRAIAGHRTRHP